MKKSIFLFIFMGICAISFAQIKVNSSGQTLIGGTTGSITGNVQVNLSSGSNNGITLKNNIYSQLYRFTVNDYSWSFANNYNNTLLSFQSQGFYVGHSYYQGYGNGTLNIMPIWNSTNTNSCSMFVGNPFSDGSASILCRNMSSTSGGVSLVSTVGNNAGLAFASAKSTSNTFSYNFYVKGNGEVYSKGVLLTSDATLKEDIRDLESPLTKIMKLHGVEYAFKDDEIEETPSVSPNATEVSDDERTPENKNATTINLPKINPDVLSQIEEEQKNARHIGFLAQEVEQVLPEIVRTSVDGTKAISYIDIIALLVEGMKEQQQIIEQLQSDIAEIQQGHSPLHKQVRKSNNVTEAALYQNTPNPFSQNTKIEYYLPTDTREAAIRVYDMNGAEIAVYPIVSFGQGELTINGGTFRAGMYLYSLIADGQLVDTKQMILTK